MMTHTVNDLPIAYLMASLLFVSMAVVSWMLLAKQRSSAANLWCFGSLLFGVGLLLIGVRAYVPAWVSYFLANALIYGANLAHIQALRQELNEPLSRPQLAALAVVLIGVQEYLRLGLESSHLRFFWALLALLLLLAWTAKLAWRIGQVEQSQSARWMAWAYGQAAVLVGIRVLMVFGQARQPDVVLGGFASAVVTLSAFWVAVSSNVTLIGIYMERAAQRQLDAVLAREQLESNAVLSGQIALLDRQRSMAEMSAALAHELSQPLTAASVDCHIAKTEVANLPHAHPDLIHSLDSLEKQVNRATQILSSIRNFMKPHLLHTEAVDLKTVVQSVMDLLPDGGRHPDVMVNVRATEAQPIVKGDAVQLSQIVLNVFRNAMQARQDGQPMCIDVQIHRQGDRLQLCIQDDGPGLTSQALAQVGAPFFTTKPDGMGVGLVISRNIAKLHGGELTVSNATNGGARVVLELPMIPNW